MTGKLRILMERGINGILSEMIAVLQTVFCGGAAAPSGSLGLVWSNYSQLLLQSAGVVVVSVPVLH